MFPGLILPAQNLDSFFMHHPSNDSSAVFLPSENASLISPMLDIHLKDVSITSDGSEYFMTGTLLEGKRTGIHLWKSGDLESWEELGVVFENYYRYTAPEIHYILNNFYIVISDHDGCLKVLRSSTGKATGPYQSSGCLVEDTTDPSLFEENGMVYLVYGKGYIVALNEDLSDTRGTPVYLKPHPLLFKDKTFTQGKAWPVRDRVGKGGAFITKINNRYYLLAHEITGRMRAATDDVFIAESDNLLGPYGKRYFAFPHAGQTTIFQSKEGDFYATYSGHRADHYAAFRERPGIFPLTFLAEQKLGPDRDMILENTAVAWHKPLITSETLRDPSITIGGDGNYYLVGTNNFYGSDYPKDGVKLWKSGDLQDWQDLGYVLKWSDMDFKPEGNAKIWAPEIKYVKSDQAYYIAFSIWVGKGTTYLFKSQLPTGPYHNTTTGPLVQGIDGFLFEDDDQTLYFLWGGGKLGILNPERSGFEKEPVRLLTVENHHVGYEGNCLTKINGKYVLTGAEWNGPLRTQGTYDMMQGVSDHIWGPYSKPVVAVPHAGHGTVFRDKEGNWYTTMFGNDSSAPWRMHFGLIPLEVGNQTSLRAK